MERFIESIRKIHNVSDREVARLLGNMTERSYAKGDILLREKSVNEHVFFLIEGFARAYVNQDDKTWTSWFVEPFHSIMYSLNTNMNDLSMVNVEFLEDSKVIAIRKNTFEWLLEESIELSCWARKYLNSILEEVNLYFSGEYFTSTEKQYERLLERSPQVMQKASLKQIASYLGVTPESLSRIRANIARRK
ncbi:Crp/Fnr family transcriptional regulator [Puteibacter caeruleilacunae]|nr:Crp/Fnr family transcriptional regulator [Puteibacter caeruleilacunae]